MGPWAWELLFGFDSDFDFDSGYDFVSFDAQHQSEDEFLLVGHLILALGVEIAITRKKTEITIFSMV